MTFRAAIWRAGRARRTVQCRQVEPDQRARAARRSRGPAPPGQDAAGQLLSRHLDGGVTGPGAGARISSTCPATATRGAGPARPPSCAAVAEAYFGDCAAGRAAFRAGTLLLVDSRHPGLDGGPRRCARGSNGLGTPFHVVATKVDKLSRSERVRNLQDIWKRRLAWPRCRSRRRAAKEWMNCGER